MFILFYGIWGEGDERYGPCVGRLASNLWLREYGVGVARGILGLPPGEHPGWCPDVSCYVLSLR